MTAVEKIKNFLLEHFVINENNVDEEYMNLVGEIMFIMMKKLTPNVPEFLKDMPEEWLENAIIDYDDDQLFIDIDSILEENLHIPFQYNFSWLNKDEKAEELADDKNAGRS